MELRFLVRRGVGFRLNKVDILYILLHPLAKHESSTQNLKLSKAHIDYDKFLTENNNQILNKKDSILIENGNKESIFSFSQEFRNSRYHSFLLQLTILRRQHFLIFHI